MWLLAINVGHNGATALYKDSELIYYIEEDRLSRMKYDGNPYLGLEKAYDYTDKVDFLILCATNNQFSTEGFFVYPNPFSEEVTFSFPTNYISREICIYNSLGQQIARKNSDSRLDVISLQSFENGMYFYKIASANETITGKLIKK